MSYFKREQRPARDESMIDAAVAQALEADPLAHAVMHARFPATVGAVNTDAIRTDIEPSQLSEQALIEASGVSPLEAAVMTRRFRTASAAN